MEQVKIVIDTNNSAFDDSVNEEVARILKDLANKIEQGQEPKSLLDFNGNKVGKVTYSIS